MFLTSLMLSLIEGVLKPSSKLIAFGSTTFPVLFLVGLFLRNISNENLGVVLYIELIQIDRFTERLSTYNSESNTKDNDTSGIIKHVSDYRIATVSSKSLQSSRIVLVTSSSAFEVSKLP